jgi:hypothetical protein
MATLSLLVAPFILSTVASADPLLKPDVETTAAASDKPAGPPPTPEKIQACKDAWIAADLNKNGVLDADEAAVYSASLQVSRKPPLTEDNLSEAGFLKDCEAETAHE